MHYGYDDLDWIEPKGDKTINPAKVTVTLNSGDTAWNPVSTKRVLYGPATVTYERYPSGIEARIDATAPDPLDDFDAHCALVAWYAGRRANLTNGQLLAASALAKAMGDEGTADEIAEVV